MASSSSTSLTLPLQLLRLESSSSRVGQLRALHRPSPASVRLRQPAKGLKPIAAVSYHDKAAGHGDNAITAATSTLLLRQVVDDTAVAAELRAARTVGRAHEAPKRRGAPSPNKVDPATKPPEEGIGGDGGKHN
ncbi:unnamed protein product [Urochloa decumbens]|uniref:Uncharacterized protein n=1 Tax=Urochloa decumbens TaxID=240449 RepID=A0ABC9BY32_9POAL